MRYGTVVLFGIILAAAGCAGDIEADWRRCNRVYESDNGRGIVCELYSRENVRTVVRIDTASWTVNPIDAVDSGQIPPGGKGGRFDFRIDRDNLLITPRGGETVRHYILDIPARASVKTGFPVSRYHGKRGHFMRIQGVYPGGVVVREPKRLHRGGGFADAYFAVSPEGTVGAEIPLPANSRMMTNHRVLFLSSKGVLIAAVKGGRKLVGLDARSGKPLFRYP